MMVCGDFWQALAALNKLRLQGPPQSNAYEVALAHLARLVGGGDVGEGPGRFELKFLVVVAAQELDEGGHHVRGQDVVHRRARLDAQHPDAITTHTRTDRAPARMEGQHEGKHTPKSEQEGESAAHPRARTRKCEVRFGRWPRLKASTVVRESKANMQREEARQRRGGKNF